MSVGEFGELRLPAFRRCGAEHAPLEGGGQNASS